MRAQSSPLAGICALAAAGCGGAKRVCTGFLAGPEGLTRGASTSRQVHLMNAEADVAEKINELLGAVAALKAYVAHLPGAADVDREAVRRAGRDTGAGLIGGVHPSTHVDDAVDDIQRMASALQPQTD